MVGVLSVALYAMVALVAWRDLRWLGILSGILAVIRLGLLVRQIRDL
ncbi:MAG: hypothetical protein QGG40_11480 [Myxococcota bacterium]|nr:hypothetical protein [Myxococcota bacterium]